MKVLQQLECFQEPLLTTAQETIAFNLTMLLNECHKCLQFMALFMDSLAAFLGVESKHLDSVLAR